MLRIWSSVCCNTATVVRGRRWIDEPGPFPEHGHLEFEPITSSHFRLTVDSSNHVQFNVWVWHFEDTTEK